jgi:hypothetical protein
MSLILIGLAAMLLVKMVNPTWKSFFLKMAFIKFYILMMLKPHFLLSGTRRKYQPGISIPGRNLKNGRGTKIYKFCCNISCVTS